MFKKNKNKISDIDILDILEDIITFFDNGEEEEDEFETCQQYIGMKELFRGYVVRNWKETNFNTTKYAELNKILVWNVVLFYNKCWLHRNECYQDAKMQRKRMISWYKKLKHKAEQDESPRLN